MDSSSSNLWSSCIISCISCMAPDTHQLSIICKLSRCMHVMINPAPRHKRTCRTCMLNRIVPPESTTRSLQSAAERCAPMSSRLGCAGRRPRAAAEAGGTGHLARGAPWCLQASTLSLLRRGPGKADAPPEGCFAHLGGQSCRTQCAVTCSMLCTVAGRAAGLVAFLIFNYY